MATTGAPRGSAPWSFLALVPLLLTPGFIGTVIFFHQVHIAEVKGWTLTAMAPGFAIYAAVTIRHILRHRLGLRPVRPGRGCCRSSVVPMGRAFYLIGEGGGDADGLVSPPPPPPPPPPHHPPPPPLALSIMGMTQGMAGTTWGTLAAKHLWHQFTWDLSGRWPRRLMVVSTAIGPGITGLAIDWGGGGVTFPEQAIFMAVWCGVLSAAMVPVMRRLVAER